MYFYLQYDHRRISKLANQLIDTITAKVPQVIRNGDPEQTFPGWLLNLL